MSHLLQLSYLGTRFSGAARVGPGRTVASELTEALARLGEVGCEVEPLSRTDAGVHARAQVAVVRGVRRCDERGLWLGLRRQLPPDLRCAAVATGEPPQVQAKTYRYALDLSAVGDPFASDRAWRPPAGVRVEALAAAAGELVGYRDFVAFRRRGETRAALTRRVCSEGWQQEGGLWVWTVSGDGFAYRLVRSLVGGMVAVARDAVPLASWRRALEGEVNPASTQQAPAHGLTLWSMKLDPEPVWFTGERAP